MTDEIARLKAALELAQKKLARLRADLNEWSEDAYRADERGDDVAAYLDRMPIPTADDLREIAAIVDPTGPDAKLLEESKRLRRMYARDARKGAA